MDGDMSESRKTVLYDKHVAAAGRMVDFAGYLMPVQYSDGIVSEHLWTRKHSGLFDVCHMGRFVFRGAGALAFLQHVLTNDASALAVGKSQYTIIANQQGGAIDDAYLYRFFEDEYLLVVNAANREKDLAHFRKILKAFGNVLMEDASERLSMVSVQGPDSADILESLVEGGTLPEAPRNSLSIVTACGVQVLLGRTGYTGEPVCFELMFPSQAAEAIWDALVNAGSKPVGLGARDTLRLEAGLPLFGHEFGTDSEGKQIPIFACPLAKFAVSFSNAKGDFIGRAALQAQHAAFQTPDAAVLPRVIRQIAILGRGIARAGTRVSLDSKSVGYITSGTMVPYWKIDETSESVELTEESGMRAVAMGLLDRRVQVGEMIEVDIRGKGVPARVVSRNLNNRADRFSMPLLFAAD